jgi:hypothetical protein
MRKSSRSTRSSYNRKLLYGYGVGGDERERGRLFCNSFCSASLSAGEFLYGLLGEGQERAGRVRLFFVLLQDY